MKNENDSAIHFINYYTLQYEDHTNQYLLLSIQDS